MPIARGNFFAINQSFPKSGCKWIQVDFGAGYNLTVIKERR